jgi:5'(3')-deoxyribonucleotidase
MTEIDKRQRKISALRREIEWSEVKIKQLMDKFEEYLAAHCDAGCKQCEEAMDWIQRNLDNNRWMLYRLLNGND